MAANRMKIRAALASIFWLLSLVSSQCAPAFAEAAATAGSPPSAAVPVPQPSRTEVTLGNGLRVVYLEDHSFPVVSCLTFYKVGARNESAGITGLTHVLEHLLFGSVGPYRKGDIAASILRVGGQFNGYTSDDFTTFFETLPGARLELALKIEAERMAHAHLEDGEFKEEIANVQREFENENKDGPASLMRETRAMLYLAHPYHHPPLGWRSDVENLTLDQVRDYYRKYFRPDNCTLVVAGDFQPNSAEQLVAKYFNDYAKPAQPLDSRKVIEPQQRGERRVVVKYPGRQEMLQLAYHAPAFTDADAAPMVVLEKLLNASYAGRLRSRLVDQKICSSADACFEAKRDPGYFALTFGAIAGTVGAQQKITDAVESMITQLRLQPVSEAELRRARNQAEMAYFSEQEGPYRAGFYLGYFDALSSWEDEAGWSDRLRAVSAADIQRVVKRYLSPDNRVVAWLSGSAAPHPGPSRPAPDSPAPKNQQVRPAEHTRLTGYKTDDQAFSPSQPEMWHYLLAHDDSASSSHTAEPDQPSQRQQAAVSKTANPVEQAIKEIPSALPSAVKDIPAAIGGAPGAIKELPAAVEKVPAVIKNIPSAIGGIPGAIKELPSAVGSIPSAIKELPGAIGGIPGAAATAVKELPAAIGGIPGAAVSTIKELPGTVIAIPGAAASAVKGMPSAIGNFAVQVGTIPGAIGKSLSPSNKLDSHVYKRSLRNGLTLLVFESHLAPVVHIEGSVRAGSAYDPAGKAGTAAVVNALFNQGTARRGHQQVVTQQEDLGLVPGQMLRFQDAVGSLRFSTRCLSRDLPAQLDLIAETLSSPPLSDADVDKARQDVLNQLKQWDDNADRKAERTMMRSLLDAASPYAPADPSEQTRAVSNIGSADVSKFIATYVEPGDTTIVVAGDVDADRAVQMAEKAFAVWGGKNPHQRLHARPAAHHVTRAAVPTRDKTHTVIGFGQLVPISRSASEFGSLLIADAVLSNHPIISRVNRRMAEQPALAQALSDQIVEARMRPLSNALAWSMTINVDPSAAPLVVQCLDDELKKLARTGVAADELSEVKRYLSGAIPVQNMSSMSTVAVTLLETATHAEEGENYWADLAGVKSATVESVNHVIRNALKPDQATLVLVGNGNSIRAVRSQVLSHSSEHDAADRGN